MWWAFGEEVGSGRGRLPSSHSEKPWLSVRFSRRKLHSDQLDLPKSRMRSAGQELSDRKRSEMVMSLEPAVFPGPGGLEFEEGGLFDGVLFAGVGLEVPPDVKCPV